MRNMKNFFGRLVVVATLACGIGLASAAPIWIASTLPGSGNISGVAGSTIGWGYEIANQDASLWLVLTSVSADAFQHAVGDALFDLPILAPGVGDSVAFDGSHGLFALTWDTDAQEGFVNFGNFVLRAEWWDGDPLAGGNFVATAPNKLLAYSALVADAPVGGTVPLPDTLVLSVSALALMAAQRRSTAGKAAAIVV